MRSNISRNIVVVMTTALAFIVAHPQRTFGAELLYGGGLYSYDDSSSGCDSGDFRRDPIGVIFRGSGARVRNIAGRTYPRHFVPGIVTTHTTGLAGPFGGAWAKRDPIPFVEHLDKYKSYDNDGVGHCESQSAQVASRSAAVAGDRYHVRLWQQAGNYRPGLYATVGTPHFDYWDEDCPNDLPLVEGNHRVPGHISAELGSGYVYAREMLRRVFLRDLRPDGTHRYGVTQQRWPNRQPIKQCGGLKEDAHSNGRGIVIHVGSEDLPPPLGG